MSDESVIRVHQTYAFIDRFQPESFVFIETVRSLVDNFTRDANDGRTRIVIADTFGDTQLRWYGQTEETPGAHIPRSLALTEGVDVGSNARNIIERILDSIDMTPIWAEPNFALGDHDASRVNFRFGEGSHEGLAMLSLMLPGPNFIYYVSFSVDFLSYFTIPSIN